MGDSEKKKLSELRVKDLRLELGLRGLDKTGTKLVLMKRLEEALEEEGKDPKTYIFGEEEQEELEDLVQPDDKKDDGENLHKGENLDELTLEDEEKLLADENEENEYSLKHEEKEEHEDQDIEGRNENEEENDESAQDDLEVPEENVEQDAEIKECSVGKSEVNKVLDNASEEQQISTDKTEEKTKEKCSEVHLIDKPNIKEPTTKRDEDSKPKDNQEDEEENKEKAKDNKNVQKRKEQSGNPTVIWISNISRTTRASELKAALHKCGKVVGAKVVLNAKYPGSNCFGHVTMATTEAVQVAIETLNNTELNGRIIQVHKFDEVRLDQQRKVSGNKLEKKDPQSSVKATEKKEKVSTKPDDKNKDTVGKPSQHQKFKSREDSKFSREHQSHFGFKNRNYPPPRNNPHYRDNRSAFLNFERIKEVRKEQQKIRDDRVHRETIKKLDSERNRQKEIDERARRERRLIEKEKEELKIEKEKLEREKQRLKKLEQEQIQRNLIQKETQALKQTINIFEEIPNRKRPRSPRRYNEEPLHFKPRYKHGSGSPDRRRPKFEPPHQGKGRESNPPRGREPERTYRSADRKNFDSRNKDRYQGDFRAPSRRFDHGSRRESSPNRKEYRYSEKSNSERGDWRKKGDNEIYTNRDPRSYNQVYNREANSNSNNSWSTQSQIRYSPPGSWGYMQPVAQPMGSMQNQGYNNPNSMGIQIPPAPSIGSYNSYGGQLRRY
ncbi:scaffold attachment factor B2-like [Anthonomus grandis grandis]|uniref:scaffold attachment factor B2-like n=1 Tax=Anthonomus grandis grandis TaxID=2921223 RepID=UPI0021653405|nr:scaffold attachment factor B2-like [Anthonomus grandis grandis]